MTDIFLKIVNVSLTSTYIVFAVLIIRIILRKAPKWINSILWGLVGLRLILPFSFESKFSLIPSARTIQFTKLNGAVPKIKSGINSINSKVNPLIQESYALAPLKSATKFENLISMFTVLWLVGILIMLIYSLVSYFSIYRSVKNADLFDKASNAFCCENIETPFVFGIFKPKIYLPLNIDEENINHIIAHERAHIKRNDYLWKPIGFLLLSIYWFNPMLWIAYIILSRDIEIACDEKVVKDLEPVQRADYSNTLLSFSVSRKNIVSCPVAFGEIGVKDRITHVLNYKRPTFWIIAISLIASILVAIFFLTNPFDSSYDNIINQKGFDIVAQNRHNIQLSIPKEVLIDECFAAKGQDFNKNEIVAFNSDTTTIYLERVQISNEGEDWVYFILNYSYDLDNDGVLLSPYKVTDLGFSTSIGLNSKTLYGDNIEVDDAVLVRGQGPDEKIYFYVSVEAIKAIEGDIKIDAFCNEITYKEHGKDESVESKKEKLTLDKVISLSKKGDELSWEDFDDYDYMVTGSGLYIRIYNIDEMFSLSIGGSLNEPMYFNLYANDQFNEFIDIRNEDVKKFVDNHKNNMVTKELPYEVSLIELEHFDDIFERVMNASDNEMMMLISSVRHLPIVRIESLKMLKSFLDETGINMDLEYDKDIFDDKDLFLIYVEDLWYRINRVKKTKEAILFSVIRDEDKTFVENNGSYFLAVLLNKDNYDDYTIDAYMSFDLMN